MPLLNGHKCQAVFALKILQHDMLGPPVRGILEEGFRFIEGNIFTGFCTSVILSTGISLYRALKPLSRAVDPSSPTSDI